jgi:hypothetical protein
MQFLSTLILSAALFPHLWGVAQVEGSFYPEKTKYLVGEPIFVILKIVNTSKQAVWVSFKDIDSTCQTIKLEVPGAKSARESWGCGIAGDCGQGSAGIEPGLSLVNGNESKLGAALAPLVAQLASQDFKARAEAVAAITDTAPPFLDDVLIDLSKTNYVYAAIQGLRKANTTKTRQALGDLAEHGSDSSIRMEALRNLARTGDRSYLSLLLRLVKTTTVSDTRTVAAEAAGDLGGEAGYAGVASLRRERRRQCAFSWSSVFRPHCRPGSSTCTYSPAARHRFECQGKRRQRTLLANTPLSFFGQSDGRYEGPASWHHGLPTLVSLVEHQPRQGCYPWHG